MRPRSLAQIALLAGLAGFLLALLPAVAGPGGLSSGYLASYGFFAVLVVVAVLILVGAVIALVTDRVAGITLMLGPGMWQLPLARTRRLAPSSANGPGYSWQLCPWR